MSHSTPAQRRRFESHSRDELEQHQLGRLNALLDEVLPANGFYAKKLADVKRPVKSLAELVTWPLTTKEELVGPPEGDGTACNLTWPRERYVRFHQTSGTSGRPMIVLDTPEDWQWFLEGWEYVLDAAEITGHDRALAAFSFGPHIGFWGAYESLSRRGAMVIPSGGMTSLQRLELARVSRPTVLCCTPSYALHLAEVGAEHGINVGRFGVRVLILAGEPGGSVPAVRHKLKQAWNAGIQDHCGATEVGGWGYGDREGNGVYVVESEFIAEFISLSTGAPAQDGEEAELVLTTLGRTGCPVFRYRTGDVVRPNWQFPGDNRFVMLSGGVLGRTDDMFIVRGVNVFPSSIDQIMHSFPEVVEYRATVDTVAEMDRLRIEVEDQLQKPERIAQELKVRLGLTVEVKLASTASLPRFEGKGRRFIDKRKHTAEPEHNGESVETIGPGPGAPHPSI